MSASRWSSRPWQYAAVAAGIAAVIGLVAAPWLTLELLFVLVAAGVLAAGVRSLVREQRAGQTDPAADQLTAEEARELADDLGLQLYRAEDALGFVAEMCDIADEHRGVRGQPATVTTERVREWLKGAQCARQAGLVLGPDASGQDPDAIRTAPDTTEQQGADQGGHHPDDLRIAADQSITRALAANPDIAAEYQRIRLMLHASRDVRTTLGRELDETKEQLRKAERAADLLADAHRRAEQAEAARESASASAAVLLAGVVRVQQMVSAWEEQLPETIRTATAVDAIRTALATPTEGSSW